MELVKEEMRAREGDFFDPKKHPSRALEPTSTKADRSTASAKAPPTDQPTPQQA